MRPAVRGTRPIPILFMALFGALLLAPSVLHAKKVETATLAPPSDSPSSTILRSTSKLVDGSVGGQLTIGKWKLEIPASAFNGVATITMSEMMAADGLPTVDLSISDPALNNFRVPVWLSHKDKNNQDKAIFWWDPSCQCWRQVPGLLVSLADALGIELKVPLYHFSSYSVRGGKAGW